MTIQEYEYFKDYIMNEDEVRTCVEIIDAVNKYKISSRPLYYGFPNVITSDLTEGYALGSIMCIKKEFGFNYYLFTVGERGIINCEDFQGILPIYKKRYGAIIPKDAFIYFLIKEIDKYSKDENNQIYLHNRHVVKAHLSENNKYKFELLHGYGSGMAQDNASYETGWNEPIYNKIKCFCGHEFFHCDKNIPCGTKYEIQCPNCKALLMRKKVE